tara:strand:+ start:335 stop:1264 length:930 start_codon:yes stop_codon:yes gene_type:complete
MGSLLMKKIKEIIAFGDSWTMGEGWVDHPEEKIAIKEREWDNEIYKTESQKIIQIRNENSWVRMLAEEYGVKWSNHGSSGSSNRDMLNKFWDIIMRPHILNSDSKPLIIVMFSSFMRDSLEIFPGPWEKTFLGWTHDEFKENPNFYTNPFEQKLKNVYGNEVMKEVAPKTFDYIKELKKFELTYRKKYIVDIFEESFLEHVNVNYVNLIHDACKYFDIPLIMCNAFETVIKDRPQYKKFKFKNYFLQDSTMYHELIKEDNYQDLFQKSEYFQEYTLAKMTGQHPNLKGYKKITGYIKEFIEKNGKHIFV